MNRLVMFCAGLLLMSSMTGCCLLHGYGYGAGYPSYGGYGGGGCGSCGGCGAAAPGYPSAMAPGGQMAFAPGMYPTVAVPQEALPTYQ
ncbi:MAG: hypothetical protein KDA81_08225 [Planctomycetaceae bacterium]|nr:hypothetical protein [Planctomycetaceae bacterium]